MIWELGWAEYGPRASVWALYIYVFVLRALKSCFRPNLCLRPTVLIPLRRAVADATSCSRARADHRARLRPPSAARCPAALPTSGWSFFFFFSVCKNVYCFLSFIAWHAWSLTITRCCCYWIRYTCSMWIMYRLNFSNRWPPREDGCSLPLSASYSA